MRRQVPGVTLLIVLFLQHPFVAVAWTPQAITVDGTNDFLLENLLDPDGYDAELSEIDIDSVFVTNDENNLYVGIQYDQGTWSDCCVGIAIDPGDVYGGLTDPWNRQIEWSEAPYPPNFVSYVSFDDDWQELRYWNMSYWQVLCGGYGGCSQATGTGFKEFQFSLATLGVSAGDTLHLEAWTTQESTKGALDLAASDARQESTPGGTNWDPTVPTKPDQYLPFVVMEVPDVFPPVLERAKHVVDDQLRLVFSEAVDEVTAETAANYTVDGAGIDSARVDDSNPTWVHLYLDQDFTPDNQFRSVTVAAVEDLSGNPIEENGTDNVAYFFVKGVLFRGHMKYYLQGWIPGSSLSFSIEGRPSPLTWELCDNYTGDADEDSVFAAYVEFSLEGEGPAGPTVDETAQFKFVHNCLAYEPLPTNRTYLLTSVAGARDTLDLWWNDRGPRRRGPYLSWQGDPSSTMSVSWQTLSKGTSRVDYGPDAGYGFAEGDSTPVEWHTVELTGLDPGAEVHYRASSSTGFLSEDCTFGTGVPVGEPFRFLAYGDTRTDSIAHQSVIDRMETEDGLVVLHSGDLVEHGGNLSEWNTFFDITEDLIARIPMMPAIGNHEDNDPLYFDFFALPNSAPPSNEQWYSFDIGGAHFICLSTETDYSVGSAQHDWMVADLAAASTPADWMFACFHRPPVSSGAHGSEMPVREAFCPVFETYGVDAVFNGHDHMYERSLYNGITYIVTGGGGAPLRDPNQNPNPYQVYAEKTYHYCRIALDRFTCLIEAVKPDGTVFDSVTLYSAGVEDEPSVNAPVRTRIVSIFPNPSAAGIEIRYSLAREIAPAMCIYDVRGREIATVETRVQPRGIHSAYWDRTDGSGNPVPAGVYWIRLSVDGATDTRKVVLVE